MQAVSILKTTRDQAVANRVANRAFRAGMNPAMWKLFNGQFVVFIVTR